MSEQSQFWAGNFGSEYISRNASPELIERNVHFFIRATENTRQLRPARVIEFGANIGMNIRALQLIRGYRDTQFTAVEINQDACAKLQELGVITYNADMLDPAEPWGGGFDIAISKGVLIHVHPNDLRAAYAALYNSSRQYILIAEYFAAERRPVEYRGHAGKLWLADYGAEIMDQYPDLVCRGYGFAWKRDPVAPQDDITWVLLEKRRPKIVANPAPARVP